MTYTPKPAFLTIHQNQNKHTGLFSALWQFLRNAFCYNLEMNETEMYCYFIKDVKTEKAQSFSKEFFKSLKGLRKTIVTQDIKSYKIKGNNNLAQLTIKYPDYSENQLQYIKLKLKHELREQYLLKLLKTRGV